ncbi:hypothetical protein JXI42_12680 [bacterium]|nr:hypothetical protein [bacterium]
MDFFDFEKINLVFQSKYLALIILAFLAAAGFSILSYRITNPPMSKRRKRLLTALRIAAFFFLFLSIFEPLLVGIKKLIIEPRLIFLIDTSKSMELEDSYGKRAETLENFLASDEVRDLEQSYKTEFFEFGDTIVPMGDALEFKYNATAIGEVLIDLYKSHSKDAIGNVVLVSDGQSNLGITPLQVTEDLPFPIHTVGIGDPSAPKDIGIKRIVANEVAYQETPFPVRVYVESWGMANEKAEVIISLKKETLEKKQITLGQKGELNEVEFEVTPLETGMQNLIVSVPSQEGEFSRKNNSRYFSVNVLASKRKVLLISKNLNWEYTFLKRTLEEDDNIQLVEHVLGKGAVPGQIARLPSDLEQLQEYECVIILGAINQISRAGPGGLFREYVGSGGSVLYFVQQDIDISPGREDYWADILPFTLTKGSNQVTMNEFNAVLTVEGRYHSITNIETSDNLPPEQAFASLPPLEGFIMVGGLKEGAKSLLVHPKLREIPILAIGNYKAGKIVSVTGFPLWRWNFVPVGFGKTTEVYTKLIHNTIQWLLVKDELEPFVLKTDKNVYKTGERVNVLAFLRNENNQPIDGAAIEAELSRTSVEDSLEFNPLSILLDEYEKGVYEQRIPSLPPGDYLLDAKASLRDKVVAEKKKKFIVEEYSLEFQNVRMDRNNLLKLAQLTGGKFFTASDYTGLPDAVKIEEKSERIKLEKNLWDNPIFLILFIIFLAIEWILRKRSDLL